MATSLESPPPASLHKEFGGGSSPPKFYPSSDEHFWSTLRSRVDTLLESRKPVEAEQAQLTGESEVRARRLKEDSMLLLRGFDSVAETLSHLSNNLENAMQGARHLSRPPTMNEIVEATFPKAKTEEKFQSAEGNEDKLDDNNEVDKRGTKRKLDSEQCSEDQPENAQKVEGKCSYDMGKIQKAKNMAISMATKAAAMARELKLVRSDLGFMLERCDLLEEENRKLRDGLGTGIHPEEDDLVRLQLEALLAEKSRLANENANLKRENQSLHQLVEYHQITSQDLSASYENLVKEMGLDFCSPADDEGFYKTPHADLSQFSKSLDDFFDEELHK